MKNTSKTLEGLHTIMPAIAMALLLTMSSQLSAEVIYTADNRYVHETFLGLGEDRDVNYYPDAPFADWNHFDQTSSLGSNGFTASGDGKNIFASYRQVIQSYFDVSFNLSTTTQVDLTGTLSVYSDGGTGRASIFLYDSADTVLYSNIFEHSYDPYIGFYNQTSILWNNVLDAGDYHIRVVADPFTSTAESGYSLQADLTSVPLPAAVWLFGSGLVGLVGLTRRKANV